MSEKIRFIITEDGKKKYATRKCSVLNCDNTNLSIPKRTFFVLPAKGKNHEKREMWLKALKKVNCSHPSHPKRDGQVCSDHFVSGFASQTRSEVDYVPTLFPSAHCKAHDGTNELYVTNMSKLLEPEKPCKIFHYKSYEGQNVTDVKMEIVSENDSQDFECVLGESQSKIWHFFLLNKKAGIAKCTICSNILKATICKTKALIGHLKIKHNTKLETEVDNAMNIEQDVPENDENSFPEETSKELEINEVSTNLEKNNVLNMVENIKHEPNEEELLLIVVNEKNSLEIQDDSAIATDSDLDQYLLSDLRNTNEKREYYANLEDPLVCKLEPVMKMEIELDKTEGNENLNRSWPTWRCIISSCNVNELSVPKRSGFAIPGTFGSSYKSCNKNKEINEQKRELWIKVIQKVNSDPTWEPIRKTRICSDHFNSGHHSDWRSDDDFVPNLFSSETQLQAKPRTKKMKTLKLCTLCGNSFDTNTHLKHHIKSVHQNLRPHKCPHCQTSLGTKSHLKAHIETVHERKKPYKCPQCVKAFGAKSKLKIHISVVHEGIRLQCDLCEASFTERGLLNRHLKKSHFEKQTKLESSTKKKRNITKVIDIDPKSFGTFKCSHCNSAFSTARGMKLHTSRVHQPVRNIDKSDM